MDQDRGRDFRRKKYPPYKKEEKPMKRPIILMKSKDPDKTAQKSEEIAPQTILLKTRDGENRAASPQASSSKLCKDSEVTPSYQITSRSTQAEPENPLTAPPIMKESTKFLEDNCLQIQDNVLEFLTDTTDFLVVGCLGLQGVGKSTVMSHLVSPPLSVPNTSELFKVQTKSNIDSATHCTQGIDIYVTQERVILLDTQPVFSLSVMSKYLSNEGSPSLAARSCSRDDPDYPCIENDMELLSLQYAAFLLSVCHVVLLIQDNIHDPEMSRFLQIAEMLKPSTGITSGEEPIVEYFPHTIFIHSKVKPHYFTSQRLKEIQEMYKKMYAQSQLVIKSGIGIANGSVLKSLTPELCDCEPVNVFFLPSFKRKGDAKSYELTSYTELIKSLRYQINGLSPASLTNTVLSEKNWYYYASKIWENVKKSSLFPEYGRLLKTPASLETDLAIDCPVS
ncbi:protein SMG9 [Cimex lectularius]|uniref:Protein SMG9 n=1 Tax=Cimex lectularius TaxID=79782 RepID=A0A8I6RKG3_CIMLE|nr:protein SMG9 [Cimex lectularius]